MDEPKKSKFLFSIQKDYEKVELTKLSISGTGRGRVWEAKGGYRFMQLLLLT